MSKTNNLKILTIILTVFAFVLAFTWLLMLLRILVNMVMRVGKVYDVELVLDLGDEE